MRAILNAAEIHGELRERLWAETANYENDTENVMVLRMTDMSPHERFFGRTARYQKSLRIFGEIGVINNGVKISGKLTNKGDVCMMIGYATDSSEGTYRLLKLSTNKVVKSRNIQWLNKMYGEYIKENTQPVSINDESDDSEDSTDDESQNQGAGDSEIVVNDATSTEQEGPTEEPVGMRTRSQNPQVSFSPDTNLNPRASNELRRLATEMSLTATSIRGTALIAESMLRNYDVTAETLLSLIGGTDTSREVPQTF